MIMNKIMYNYVHHVYSTYHIVLNSLDNFFKKVQLYVQSSDSGPVSVVTVPWPYLMYYPDNIAHLHI